MDLKEIKKMTFFEIPVNPKEFGTYYETGDSYPGNILLSWGLNETLKQLDCYWLLGSVLPLASSLYQKAVENPYFYLWGIFILPEQGTNECCIVVEDNDLNEHKRIVIPNKNLRVNLEISQNCRIMRDSSQNECLLYTRKES